MTTDKEQADRVADRIEAGMVYVNLVGADSPELPFGGFKRSGFGRELGRYGSDEFVNKKLIRSACVRSNPREPSLQEGHSRAGVGVRRFRGDRRRRSEGRRTAPLPRPQGEDRRH